MLEVFEHGEKHASFAHEVQAFVQATQIAYPVENAVDVAIDLVEGEVELKRDLHLHLEIVLHGAMRRVCYAEHIEVFLGELAKLEARVLQLQVC